MFVFPFPGLQSQRDPVQHTSQGHGSRQHELCGQAFLSPRVPHLSSLAIPWPVFVELFFWHKCNTFFLAKREYNIKFRFRKEKIKYSTFLIPDMSYCLSLFLVCGTICLVNSVHECDLSLLTSWSNLFHLHANVTAQKFNGPPIYNYKNKSEQK